MKPSISPTGILIVADDLTGAADCGIACAGAGLQATVLLGRGIDADSAEADVVAVDLDTRRMTASQSAAATEQVVREQLRGARQLLYKKLDSTLRGHLGVELMGCLKAFRKVMMPDAEGTRMFAVVAPAFPKIGRTMVAGRQFVSEVPLHETEIWKREGLGSDAHLPDMLRASGMATELVGLHVVRSGQELLRHALKELGRHTDAVICDAETDEDLHAIAAASYRLHPAVMWAGSAGLAHQLLRVAALPRRERAKEDNGRFADGPTLFVVGSMSSLSRTQADVLRTEGDIRSICIDPSVLRGGSERCEWSAYEHAIGEELRNGYDMLVQLGSDEPADLHEGRLLATAMARLIEPCADTIGALTLTGGETGREVLDILGVRRLSLIGEIEPGLPFSVSGGWKRRLPVLTKAGAFGNPQSLVRCRKFLRRLDRRCMPLNVGTEIY